jgi:hypothetical protein
LKTLNIQPSKYKCHRCHREKEEEVVEKKKEEEDEEEEDSEIREVCFFGIEHFLLRSTCMVIQRKVFKLL